MSALTCVFRICILLGSIIVLSACGGGGGGGDGGGSTTEDTTPGAFSFTDQSGAELNAVITSNAITVSGINAATAISITGGTYSIGGGAFGSAARTVTRGQTVQVRQTSSASFSTTTNAVLTIGGVNDTFSVTTLAEDVTPDAFSFTDQTGVALSTVSTSNTITVSGINTAVAISVTGGAYSIDGGAFTEVAGTLTSGQTVQLRQTSSSSFSATTDTVLTIGGTGDTFSVTTLAEDTAPDAFSLTDQTGVALSSERTSNSITVNGINSAAAISITGGTYSIEGGAFTAAAGTVTNGQSVQVRQTSSPNFSTTTDAVLTIGGVNDTFSVTTIDDTVPDAFNFTDQTNLTLNTLTVSNSITVGGINAATAISVTGGSYSINGGSFTNLPGTVGNGQTVQLRQTSSSSFATTTDTVLTIGGVSDTFSVTTFAEDTTPDAFSFVDQTDIVPITVMTSNSITVSGINSTSPVSVTGGEYSKNGGAFTSISGSVVSGDSIRVRQTSTGLYLTTMDTTLTIGGVVDAFSVTTKGLGDGWSDPVAIGSLSDTVWNQRNYVDADGVVSVAMKAGPIQNASNLYVRSFNENLGFGNVQTIDNTGTVSFIDSITGDSQGNLLLIWSRASGEYFARGYTKQTNTWGTTVSLAELGVPDRMVVRDPVYVGDLVYIVTYELNAGVAHYYIRSYSNAGGWSDVETIYQGGSEFVLSKDWWSFHIDAQSNFHVAWMNKVDTTIRLLYSRKDDGETTWSVPEEVFQGSSPTTIALAKLIEDSQGVFILFAEGGAGAVIPHIGIPQGGTDWDTVAAPGYEQYVQIGDELFFVSEIDDSGTSRFVSQVYSRIGGLEAWDEIGNAGECISSDFGSVALGVDSAGRVVVAWGSCTDQIWVNVHDTVTGWETAQRVDVQMVGGGTAANIKLVIDADDNAFVFWATSTHSAAGYLASARWSSSGGWVGETLLESSNAGLSDRYTVAANTDGIHAVWAKQPHSAAGTYFTAHYDGVWQDEEDLTPAAPAQYPFALFNLPELIVLPSGRMVALSFWNSGSLTDLYATVYSPVL
jgi:hypothetical protein